MRRQPTTNTSESNTGPPMFRATANSAHSPFIALQRANQRVKALQQKQVLIDKMNKSVRTSFQMSTT